MEWPQMLGLWAAESFSAVHTCPVVPSCLLLGKLVSMDVQTGQWEEKDLLEKESTRWMKLFCALENKYSSIQYTPEYALKSYF